MLSIFGILAISQINEGHFISNIFSFPNLLVFVIVLAISFGIWKYIGYRNSIYGLIDKNTNQLNKQINNNSNDIRILKEKIIETRQKLFALDEVDNKVKEVTESNISLWEDQVKIHNKICNLCQQRISSLQKNKNELDLLYHLIKQMKNEPNAGKKLMKLNKLINEIDGKVNLKISNEIEKLIRDLKTDTRKEKIIQLQERITQLESIAV